MLALEIVGLVVVIVVLCGGGSMLLGFFMAWLMDEDESVALLWAWLIVLITVIVMTVNLYKKERLASDMTDAIVITVSNCERTECV